MKLIMIMIVTILLNNSNGNIKTCEGKFYHELDAVSVVTNETEHLYQFRSDDNSVWWLLTAEEIGHIPNTESKYVLTYDDKGTTEQRSTCDCLVEWDCECHLYDDEFISISQVISTESSEMSCK